MRRETGQKTERKKKEIKETGEEFGTIESFSATLKLLMQSNKTSEREYKKKGRRGLNMKRERKLG